MVVKSDCIEFDPGAMRPALVSGSDDHRDELLAAYASATGKF
jgi:hypothetical protein